MDERTVTMNWAHENGLAYVDLDRISIDDSTLARVPRQLALEHRVVPLVLQGNTLFLALGRPLNSSSIEAVSKATGLRIVPVVAEERSIDKALARVLP